MALVPYHVTNSSGLTMFFGDDITDGWPIQVALVNNQTFYVDLQNSSPQRLRVAAAVAAGQVAAGVASTGAVAPAFGSQNKWFRQKSAVAFFTNIA